MSQHPQQQPVQKPSLGRVVLFSQQLAKSCAQDAALLPGIVEAREYAALVVHVDEARDLVHLHVLMTAPACPVRVATAPATPELLDMWGCGWRWPPRA